MNLPTLIPRIASPLALLLSLTQSAVLAGQSTGGFVTTLGADTIALERFTRKGDSLVADVLETTPRLTLTHYAVYLGANGQVREFRFSQRFVGAVAPSGSVVMTFGADSIRTTLDRLGRITYLATLAQPDTRPERLYFWALNELETAGFGALRATGDSTSVWMMSPGGRAAYRRVFRKEAPDTVSTTWFSPGYRLRYVTGPQGTLRGMDGRQTTVKLIAERVTELAFDQLVSAAAERERTRGPVGALSQVDSSTSSAAGATFKLVYSRPAKRNRQVWGGVVPLDTVWRTGAGAATSLQVSNDVRIGGVLVPAGAYTIYSMPTSEGALLIVNREVGQWGTVYHEAKDLARIPMKVLPLDRSVEQLTIGLETPQGGLPLLFIEWDRQRWTVAIAPGLPRE